MLKFFYGYKLISYNHAFTRRNTIERLFIKLLYLMYDKIIFYTEKSMIESQSQNLIQINKSGFANNTLYHKSKLPDHIIKKNSCDLYLI